MSNKGTVSLGPAYLRKERDQLYPEWQKETFRELTQNSMDAGATEIDITISLVDDATLELVEFRDNGPGMTEEVLRNVYFRLGETTKGDGDEGGFGRARILTNFSAEKYEILTNGLKVLGSGTEWEIQKDPENRPGCTQRVWWPQDYPGMRHHLNRYLSECSLKGVKITIDGEEHTSDYDPGELVKTLTLPGAESKFADVWARKADVGKIVFRVRGRSTFSQTIGVKKHVTVELEPSLCKKMLNASRSSFMPPYKEFVDQFLQALQTEDSALNKEVGLVYRRVLYKGKSGPQRVNPDGDNYIGSSFTVTDEAEVPTGLKKIASMFRGTKVATAIVDMLKDEPPKSRTHYLGGDDPLRGPDVVAKRVFRASEFFPDIPVMILSQNKEVLDAATWFDPETWEFTITGDRVNWGRNAAFINLYIAWLECCREAARAFSLYDHRASFSWASGWAFSDYALASHAVMDGVHAVMLNPVDRNGTIRFDPDDPEQLRRMGASACHEFAHCRVEHHNEKFAKVMTEIMGRYDHENVRKAYREARVRRS